MLIRGASIRGRRADCRLRDGRVAELGDLRPVAGDQVLDAAGGALLPGLADHHLHLLGTAAAASSVELSAAPDRQAMLRLLAAPAAGPIRAVGWYEARHGELDVDALDALAGPGRSVRVQHRSGALWVLNTAALRALPSLEDPGVERDAAGRPTGRLWRADHLLRGLGPVPDLAALGRRLAGYGLTHLTDATPDLDAGALDLLTGGALPQRLLLLGAPDGWPGTDRAAAGPAKIVVADHALPDLDVLAARIAGAHAAGRAAALHCVTRAALVLALAAWQLAGARLGDRVEHAAVAGPAEIAALSALGIRVVTQPSLVARRGSSYVAGSDAADVPDLWPYASLLAGGVPVACSSDAPYGDPDPWATVRAARDRLTDGGVVLGAGERVPAATALRSLLTDPAAPGGEPRRITAGMAADLVLLRVGLDEALDDPHPGVVRHTFCAGIPAERLG